MRSQTGAHSASTGRIVADSVAVDIVVEEAAAHSPDTAAHTVVVVAHC